MTIPQVVVDVLNNHLDLSFTEKEYLMIFFLVSKSEHDNEDPAQTFLSADGSSVFLYCEALKYDYKDRGCTMGVVGYTTSNSGRSDWGDAQPVLRRLLQMGGPNLLDLADRCHTDKDAADTFCRTIHRLGPQDTTLMIRAQMEALCGSGYFGQTISILRELEVPLKPLLVAAVFDSCLNFGIFGNYCPIKFLKKHGVRRSKTKTLRKLLKWKRVVGCKNDHNSCKSNGRNRSDMFKQLFRRKIWNLDEVWCKEVVTWKMK